MFRCPPQNCKMAQYFSQPFPKPGRNVFTQLLPTQFSQPATATRGLFRRDATAASLGLNSSSDNGGMRPTDRPTASALLRPSPSSTTVQRVRRRRRRRRRPLWKMSNLIWAPNNGPTVRPSSVREEGCIQFTGDGPGVLNLFFVTQILAGSWGSYSTVVGEVGEVEVP